MAAGMMIADLASRLWLGRSDRQGAADELPPDLAEALETALIIPRQVGEEGEKTYVVLGSGGGFQFSASAAERAIRRRWAGLTDGQVTAAVGLLDDRIKTNRREAARAKKKTNWVTDY
jgi:hypothetical protein